MNKFNQHFKIIYIWIIKNDNNIILYIYINKFFEVFIIIKKYKIKIINFVICLGKELYVKYF